MSGEMAKSERQQEHTCLRLLPAQRASRKHVAKVVLSRTESKEETDEIVEEIVNACIRLSATSSIIHDQNLSQ